MNLSHKAAEAERLQYRVPSTYLIRNKQEEGKEAPDRKNLSADGPAYTISKCKREHLLKNVSYGKDGKEPPHSYLNIAQWYIKKDGKDGDLKPKSVERKTYIDDVMAYNNKHKYPGPDQYFKENKKKDEKKEKDKDKDKKKVIRPCYLDDYQYIGLNNPAPGAYNPQLVNKRNKGVDWQKRKEGQRR